MNRNYKRVPTNFGPEARFEVRPAPPAPFRVLQENELERLKARLVQAQINRLEEFGLATYVRRAANEAAALAWVTPYPTLVFPVLFEEKTAVAFRQAEKQEFIRERSAMLLAV